MERKQKDLKLINKTSKVEERSVRGGGEKFKHKTTAPPQPSRRLPQVGDIYK